MPGYLLLDDKGRSYWEILDPWIWGRIPDDILFIIISYLDTKSQKQWAQVSQTFYSYACSRIWDTIRLKGSYFDAYVALGERKEPMSAVPSDGIIHFLIHNPFRPNPSLIFGGLRDFRASQDLELMQHLQKSIRIPLLELPLPSSHVKRLRIDNRALRCRRDSLDSVLPVLLKCFPSLLEFSYDGPLLQTTLTAFLSIQSLERLDIRYSVGEYRLSVASDPTPWRIAPLNFGVLGSGLRDLRKLVIGRFQQEEARTLAEVVSSLKLEVLVVDCDRCTMGHGKTASYTLLTSTSPLVVFMQYLSMNGGFPSTLRILRLLDGLHNNSWPVFQLIAKTIQACSRLEEWCVQLITNVAACNEVGLQPTPTRLELQSWRSFASDEQLEVVVQYRSPSRELRMMGLFPDCGTKPITNLGKTLDDLAAPPAFGRPKRHAAVFYFRRNIDVPRNAISLVSATRNVSCDKSRREDEEISQLSKALQSFKVR